MSHHSEHEMAQNFIQFKRVIAEMSVPRQKWGKTMALRHNRRLIEKKRCGGLSETHPCERQRQ